MDERLKMEAEKKTNFIEWNDRMFKKYSPDGMYNHPNFIIRWIERKRIKAIKKLANIKDDEKVLELGCGDGYILAFLNAGEIYGIDISQVAIDRAKKRLSGNTRVKHLAVDDGEKTSFSSKFFDVIICSEVIEHVPKPAKLVEEMARLAKPTGRIIITFPNESLINKMKSLVRATGLFRILMKNIPKRMDHEWHLHSFNLDLFRKTTRGKLKIKSIKKIPLFFLPLRYAALTKIE